MLKAKVALFISLSIKARIFLDPATLRTKI